MTRCVHDCAMHGCGSHLFGDRIHAFDRARSTCAGRSIVLRMKGREPSIAAKTGRFRVFMHTPKIRCNVQRHNQLESLRKLQIDIHGSNRMDIPSQMTKFRLPGNEEAIPRSQVPQGFPQLIEAGRRRATGVQYTLSVEKMAWIGESLWTTRRPTKKRSRVKKNLASRNGEE